MFAPRCNPSAMHRDKGRRAHPTRGSRCIVSGFMTSAKRGCTSDLSRRLTARQWSTSNRYVTTVQIAETRRPATHCANAGPSVRMGFASHQDSSVAQWQRIRLLTGGLLVRVQPEEPLSFKISAMSDGRSSDCDVTCDVSVSSVAPESLEVGADSAFLNSKAGSRTAAASSSANRRM